MTLKTLLPRLAPLALGLALAGPAHAQEDPIAALLDKAPSPAPPPAAQPAQPPAQIPPPEAPPPQAYVPPPPRPAYVPRAPAQGEPTHIEETGKAPDGPPSPSDLYFESRVRQSFAAAQGMQGPMDGRWVVRSGGVEVYDLQLVDKNRGTVEGAWRDPRRKGAADASGFIDSIQRSGGELILRFQPRPGADPVQLSLRQAGDAWTGELIERGERRSVTVRRN